MLQLVFDSLDADGSGGVSLEELVGFTKHPVNRMCMRLFAATRSAGVTLEQLFRDLDEDNSGTLEFKEFCTLCRERLKMVDSRAHLMLLFQAVDDDGSGG